MGEPIAAFNIAPPLGAEWEPFKSAETTLVGKKVFVAVATGRAGS